MLFRGEGEAGSTDSLGPDVGRKPSLPGAWSCARAGSVGGRICGGEEAGGAERGAGSSSVRADILWRCRAREPRRAGEAPAPRGEEARPQLEGGPGPPRLCLAEPARDEEPVLRRPSQERGRTWEHAPRARSQTGSTDDGAETDQ